MKDNLIRIRVHSKEKRQMYRDAKCSGFDDLSSYLLHLARQNRSAILPRKK